LGAPRTQGCWVSPPPARVNTRSAVNQGNITPTSQSVMAGNATRITTRTRSDATKGVTPE